MKLFVAADHRPEASTMRNAGRPVVDEFAGSLSRHSGKSGARRLGVTRVRISTSVKGKSRPPNR